MENEQESEAIVQAMLGSTGISEEATIVTEFGAEYSRFQNSLEFATRSSKSIESRKTS